MKIRSGKHLYRDNGTGLLAGALLASLSATTGAAGGFQYNALFNPSQEQLRAEQRGRVMIYDGLDNALVERALDEEFGRIEHMMFIRIRHPQPAGGYTVEDDDC